MKTINVIKTGVRSDSSHWNMITMSQQGFILTGFVKSEEELAIGEQQIPSVVLDAVKWTA